jgi:hypothetical protein
VCFVSVEACIMGGTEMLMSSVERVKWVLWHHEVALAAA